MGGRLGWNCALDANQHGVLSRAEGVRHAYAQHPRVIGRAAEDGVIVVGPDASGGNGGWVGGHACAPGLRVWDMGEVDANLS
eukprot:scaffold15511_cov135-Isochrysis_galbana.AAC.3